MTNVLIISTGSGDWSIKENMVYRRGTLLTLPHIKTFGQAVNYVIKKLGSIELMLSNDPDRITDSWHIDDVISQAKNSGRKISRPQAREILRLIENDHDATIGINWDTINYHIEEYLEEKAKEKEQAPAEL